ncbi:MAG TPA: AI-2E family transporter [Thermoanaerobaculia bacterium]|nr:AI-2E family transporter [Thermoanaerobaculia bacterium]
MDISARTALRTAAIVFAVLIALRFLWIAHAIFFVAFLAILLGLALAKAADWLERHRVRRSIGAPATLLGGILIFALIAMLVWPSIRNQTDDITRELPKVFKSIDQRFHLAPLISKELRGMTRMLFPIFSSVIGAVGGLVLVLFMAMYIAIEPDIYRKGIVHLIPHRARPRADTVLATLADTLRQWLIARLLAMVAIGAITGLGLALLRVKAAGALGLLAGALEIIPFFGPIVSAVPAVGVALVDSPQKAIGVIALYTIVQQLEGHVITPLILRKRLDIPPVLTIVSVSSMGLVFGVIGMLIAEPLLAAVLVLTKMLYVQDVVHDDVSVGKS